MQMLHILCSNKRNNPANKDRLAQREGGGWAGGCDVEWKGSDLMLVLLSNAGRKVTDRAGVVNSVHTILPEDSEMRKLFFLIMIFCLSKQNVIGASV